MTKEIPLTNGLVAIVDDEDYEYLSQFKWYARKHYNTYYASRTDRVENGIKIPRFSMHQLIMGRRDGMIIDHKDRNGLNNTRDNLRFVTVAQNAWNATKRPPRGSEHPSQFKGVIWKKDQRKWVAFIVIAKDKKKHLGSFASEYDAALAYDVAAFKLRGEYARLNLVTHEWLAAVL